MNSSWFGRRMPLHAASVAETAIRTDFIRGSLSDFAQTAYLESKHVKMALVRLIVAQIKKAIL
jgi:hypothetical protein